jgi:hypothetical protein
MPSTILVANSLPEAGASNISSGGDSFDLELSPPLTFPSSAKVRVCCAEAGTWFSYPNIKASLNNNTLYVTDDATAEKYPIVFADGLYGLDSINLAMSLAFETLGFPSDLFQFTGDDATGRVFLQKAASTTAFRLHFGTASPNVELGFAANTSYPNANQTGAYNVRGPFQAKLDTVSTVMIHCSLVSGSSYVGNGVGAAIACFTPGDAQVGQLINYRPPFQQWIDVSKLSGSSVSRLTFWITDQSGRRGSVSTGGEPFSVSLVIEWN